MRKLADLQFHYLGVEGQTFANDPFRQLDAARKVHPWLAKTSFCYMIAEYRTARELIVHENKLRGLPIKFEPAPAPASAN